MQGLAYIEQLGFVDKGHKVRQRRIDTKYNDWSSFVRLLQRRNGKTFMALIFGMQRLCLHDTRFSMPQPFSARSNRGRLRVELLLFGLFRALLLRGLVSNPSPAKHLEKYITFSLCL